MTSPGNHSDGPHAQRITLTITGTELPSEEDDLQSLLEHLEEAARTVLTDVVGKANADIDSCLSHWYATVKPTCPDCGRLLDLQDIYLGDGTTAYSLAVCPDSCGWSGDAVFRVIDLDRRVGEEDYESAVLVGRATVIYRPYSDREN